MHVIAEEGKRPIKAWTGRVPQTGAPDIEATALAQLKNLAGLSFIHPNGVAVMPDVHAGIGATVGSVIATEGAIIPAAVGVDIGCGMNAVRTSLAASDLPDTLAALRDAIEKAVPLGAGGRHQPDKSRALYEKYAALSMGNPMPACVDELVQDYYRVAGQIGTLGSGNHFIEVCLDEAGHVWVMLHSGSRGIGNLIGRRFIERAKKRMEEYFIHLPDGDLAYLPEDTDDFKEYQEALTWAQNYALVNRREMMEVVLAAMRAVVPKPFTLTTEAVNCHHNYVSRENHFGRNVWVTRKGAIRARDGELGIIPGSMGTRSYIVRGKGNLESYCSCSHGAGRVMSRSQARKVFTTADLAAQTEGVECRKDDAILDEIPGAYKDIDAVMENQKDLVEVVHTLRAVLCVKGG